MSTSSREGANGIRHKLLSHLLGLDEEKQDKPKRWKPSLQGLKLSDALSGITFSQNFMWFVLFAGFFLWLFVIYWVRHHEPLANQVIGEPKDHAPTAGADRELVAGIKRVLPVRTSDKTGDFFVPYNDHFGTTSAPPAQMTYQEPEIPSASSPYGPIHHPYDPARHPWLSNESPSPYVQTLPSTPLVAHPMQGNYMVGIQTRGGTKVKTIVNQ